MELDPIPDTAIADKVVAAAPPAPLGEVEAAETRTALGQAEEPSTKLGQAGAAADALAPLNQAETSQSSGPLDKAVDAGASQLTRWRPVALAGAGLLVLAVMGAVLAGRGPTAVDAPLVVTTAPEIRALPPVEGAAPGADANPEIVPPGSEAVAAPSVEEGGSDAAETAQPQALAPAAPPQDVAPSVGPSAVINAPGFTGVNLRQSPSTSAPLIQVVPIGARVEVLAGQTQDGELAWQQVRTTDGTTGWVVAGTIEPF